MSWCTHRPQAFSQTTEVCSLIRTEEGQEIDVRVFGIVKMGPEAAKLFGLQPDMATVPFGWISESFQIKRCAFLRTPNSLL